jgi:ribosomal protein S18 acetylase RimI-like enzyme
MRPGRVPGAGYSLQTALMDDYLLTAIEGYYDMVPRSAARVEQLPPFVLFVQQGAGWPYYARPMLGADRCGADEVAAVRARQRELGVPESFEWVAEVTPALREPAETAGLLVTDHPLMVQSESATDPRLPPGVTVRLVTPGDDLATLSAVARVGFAFPGTDIGSAGADAVAEAASAQRPEQTAFQRGRLTSGLSVMAVAEAGGAPVAVGSYQPVGSVCEITGVATLPAFRRRGIAAALTAFLARDARSRGVRTVFLSADDEVVARVYARIGFRRIATACIGEPPEGAAE